MTRALLLLLLTALHASALSVEVASFGWEGFYRRSRPAPLAIRVKADEKFQGDLVLEGGGVSHVIPLDLPPRSEREIVVWFSFAGGAEAAWRAGSEGGKLELGGKEPDPGAALVAVEKGAARKVETYKADFPPGSRFFFAEMPAAAGVLDAVDAVILKERGSDRSAWFGAMAGAGAFRARGGAILWVDGGQRVWEGRMDVRDDASIGEDVYAVFERPRWTEAPRPYLSRLFLLAVAPVFLAVLVVTLLPGGRRARLLAGAGSMAAGTVLAALAGPGSMAIAETWSIETTREGGYDRRAWTAWTTTAPGDTAFRFPAGEAPEPVFFSPRDAQERRISVRHLPGGFEASAGRTPAGSTTAFLVRSTRARDSLRVDGARATNETARDFASAHILRKGRAAWIGDLPAGGSALASGSERLADLRQRVPSPARRRILEAWWRRADRERSYFVAFAEDAPEVPGETAHVIHHGALVVVPLPD